MTGLEIPPIDPSNNIEFALSKLYSSICSSKVAVEDKANYLRFYIHFVGDIHQPLHATTLYDQEFPDGDLGGNKFKLTNASQSNLHSFWDSMAGQVNNNIHRPLSDEHKEYLSSLADAYLQEFPLPPPPATWANSNYTLWANESYELAVTYAYNITPFAVPDQDYIDTAQELLRHRVSIGGSRLWYMLNQMNASGCFPEIPVPDIPEVDPDNKVPDPYTYDPWALATIILGVVVAGQVVFIFRSRKTTFSSQQALPDSDPDSPRRGTTEKSPIMKTAADSISSYDDGW